MSDKLMIMLAFALPVLMLSDSHSALSATLIEPGSSIEIQCSAPVGVAVELSWPPSTTPTEVSHYTVMINNTAYTTPSYPWQGELVPGNHIVSSAAVGTNGKVSGFTVKSLIIVTNP